MSESDEKKVLAYVCIILEGSIYTAKRSQTGDYFYKFAYNYQLKE